MKPFEFSRVELEAIAVRARIAIPETTMLFGKIEPEVIFDHATRQLIIQLRTEIYKEVVNPESIPIEFSWFTYPEDAEIDIYDTRSYIMWLHHGRHKEHRLVRTIDLTQYYTYPKLPFEPNQRHIEYYVADQKELDWRKE